MSILEHINDDDVYKLDPNEPFTDLQPAPHLDNLDAMLRDSTSLSDNLTERANNDNSAPDMIGKTFLLVLAIEDPYIELKQISQGIDRCRLVN